MGIEVIAVEYANDVAGGHPDAGVHAVVDSAVGAAEPAQAAVV